MYATLRFAEDTADPIRLQIGTPQRPVDLEGATVQVRLKDRSSGEVLTSASVTVQEPAAAGVVHASWPSGALVAGRSFLVEAPVTLPGGVTRTYPGANEKALQIDVIARRTAPTP